MLNVILSIDERLDDVKRCADSIQKIYGNKIALATYGGREIGIQPKTKKYAEDRDYPYFDTPRHLFLPEIREWHACETLARIQITNYFSFLGYEDIYIMHADVVIKGDFRSYFEKQMYDNKWSFVAILLRATESFDKLCNMGSWGLRFANNRARLADILTIYNPEFIMELYKEFGNDEGIWDNLLCYSTLMGDLAQFDLARKRKRWTGRFVREEILEGTIEHCAREKIPDCIPKDRNYSMDLKSTRESYEARIK